MIFKCLVSDFSSLSSVSHGATLKLVPLPLISTLHLCAKWKPSYFDGGRMMKERERDSWTNNLIHYFNEVSRPCLAYSVVHSVARRLKSWHSRMTFFFSTNFVWLCKSFPFQGLLLRGSKINQLFKLNRKFFSFPLFSKADQYAKLWAGTTHSHITNEQKSWGCLTDFGLCLDSKEMVYRTRGNRSRGLFLISRLFETAHTATKN